jgi:hypothetical protein
VLYPITGARFKIQHSFGGQIGKKQESRVDLKRRFAANGSQVDCEFGAQTEMP